MLVAIHIKVARTNSLLVMGCMAASIVLWSISCFLNSYNVSYIMWTVGLLTVLVGYAAHSTTTRRKHEDVGYITERLGLFVMLVMGESILGIVLNAHLGDTSTYMIAGFGFFTVFNIHLCYFETIPAEGIENALHSNAIRSQLVYLGHLFACFGLLCVGMGYKTAMKYNETTQSTRNQWIFCGGLALALFAMQIIRTANQDGFHGEYYFATKFRVFLLLVRLTVPIIVATMPLWGLDTVDLILAIFGATSIYVALDIYGHFRYERDLNLVLLNESSNAYLGLEGLEYLQDPFPDLSDFVGWDVVEVRLWMKNDLGAGLESLDKAEKFDITAEKLFRASAAEIIIVFGDKDGGRIVVELSRIASGNKMTGNFDSNVAEA
ncbi:hypothetical protein SARC_03487 [Sphaeroforma arctica JP610]|uniref:Uncharacterized protein n=1 Tax=Sphaeroforma arctica JP610 TaxID=667725 RepID=A0A0L0G611_9EUKA|nr:hypothetical protein SARC_03487 [Sphaeroforma arctica JP610]KNC84286.1 hypothetical protein SARC_03487 [Sphaeroforma arctica JP610]|eukprot:XP_014158188.1 hypothetical protein SARC_03487 [Sphaeroforma arctica JP610]